MGFRRGGFSPPLKLLMSAFALPIPPAALSSHLQRPTERSPTIPLGSTASADDLAPVNLPRRTTRLVSYYAFFKGWLLLSQPPRCLCRPTSFPTEPSLGGLSRRSGLFPSRPRTLAPAVCLPRLNFPGFGVCYGLVTPSGAPSRDSALPPGVRQEGLPK